MSEKRYINPYQMFHGSMVPNWLACRRELTPGAKFVYARLTQHAGAKGVAYPRQKTLAKNVGLCERQAHSYLRELVKYGLIESDRTGLGQANRYRFLDHPWITDPIPLEDDEDSLPEPQDTAPHAPQVTASPSLEKTHRKDSPGKVGVSPEVEAIYQAYPRKVGKPSAIRAITKALKSISARPANNNAAWLLAATKRYAGTRRGEEDKYTPHPATWFNDERYDTFPSPASYPPQERFAPKDGVPDGAGGGLTIHDW